MWYPRTVLDLDVSLRIKNRGLGLKDVWPCFWPRCLGLQSLVMNVVCSMRFSYSLYDAFIETLKLFVSARWLTCCEPINAGCHVTSLAEVIITMMMIVIGE